MARECTPERTMTLPTDGESFDAYRKSFLGHLEDLRFTIIAAFLSLLAGMLVALPLAPRILSLLKVPLEKAGKDPSTFLVVLEMTGPFSLAMRVIFWSGLVLSFPFITYFVGRFVFPGLLLKERKAVLLGLGSAVVLFAAGVALGYKLTLPLAMRVMFRIGDWIGVAPKFVEVGSYAAFVLQLLIGFGCAFELPVVVLSLGRLGIVSSLQLRDKRRHVIIGLLALAMLLTPPDPYSMVLMAIPLVLLYELCVWLTWSYERNRGTSPEQGGA